MKKIITILSFFLATSFGFCQDPDTLFFQDFQGFNGFGENVPGWKPNSSGFKVGLGHGVPLPGGSSSSGKGLRRNFTLNARRDSIATPWIGPLTENSVFFYDSRLAFYSGIIATFNYNVDPQDSIILRMTTSDDSLKYTLFKNLKNQYVTNNTTYKSFAFPITGMAGKKVRMQWWVIKGPNPGINSTDWYMNIDNVGLTTITAAQTNLKEKNILMYPNPAKDRLFISGIEQQASVFIYTLDGSLALKQNMAAHEPEMNISALKTGFYLAVVKEGDQIVRQKFIKE